MAQANQALRSLYKDYDEKVKPVHLLIKNRAEEKNKSIMSATIELMKEYEERENYVLWLISACFDFYSGGNRTSE